MKNIRNLSVASLLLVVGVNGYAGSTRIISVDSFKSADQTKTWTPPAATDTLVGRASTDTLTNKSISGSTNTLSNIADGSLSTSYVKADGSRALTGNWSVGNFSITANSVILGQAANTISGLSTIINTGTITLPTATTTLVGRGTTDTLTNKSISYDTNTLTLAQGTGLKYKSTSTAITLTTNSNTKIVFPTSEWDTDSYYNSSTGIFTPTVAGKYRIEISMHLSGGVFNSNSLSRCLLFDNTAGGGAIQTQTSQIQSTTSSGYQHRVNCTFYLNASASHAYEFDYNHQANSNLTMDGDGGENWIAIQRLF